MKNIVEVQHDSCEHGAKMTAKQAFAAGERLFEIRDYTLKSTPCYRSVQMSESRHIVNPTLAYMNHSCDPSVMLDTERMECRALHPLNAGDEITFFYPSSEWAMDEPFRCNCGSANCLGYIDGARMLADEILFARHVNPHIRRMKANAPVHLKELA